MIIPPRLSIKKKRGKVDFQLALKDSHLQHHERWNTAGEGKAPGSLNAILVCMYQGSANQKLGELTVGIDFGLF